MHETKLKTGAIRGDVARAPLEISGQVYLEKRCAICVGELYDDNRQPWGLWQSTAHRGGVSAVVLFRAHVVCLTRQPDQESLRLAYMNLFGDAVLTTIVQTDATDPADLRRRMRAIQAVEAVAAEAHQTKRRTG